MSFSDPDAWRYTPSASRQAVEAGFSPFGDGYCDERAGVILSTMAKKNSRHLSQSHPAHAPTINAVADDGRLAEGEKPGLNFHGHPCMALPAWTVKVLATAINAARTCVQAITLLGRHPFRSNPGCNRISQLSAGTRLGPYQILAPIGAGGVEEVYRAHDPRNVWHGLMVREAAG
jgi:hypothetical protein